MIKNIKLPKILLLIVFITAPFTLYAANDIERILQQEQKRLRLEREQLVTNNKARIKVTG